MALPGGVEEIAVLEHGLDTLFILCCTALTLLMQIGLVMLEYGTCRRNQSMRLLKRSFIHVVFSCFGFLSSLKVLGHDRLCRNAHGQLEYELVLFHVALCSISTMVAFGCMAERLATGAAAVFSLVMSVLIYPALASSLWSLPSAGESDRGLLGFLQDVIIVSWFEGHRPHDFAGAGVVHLSGAVAGACGMLLIGVRICLNDEDGGHPGQDAENAGQGRIEGRWLKRYEASDKKSEEDEFRSSCITAIVFGIITCVVGMCGVNAGVTGTLSNKRVALVVWNTMVTAAGGGFLGYVISCVRYGRLNIPFVAHCIMSGLVISSGICDLNCNDMVCVMLGCLAAITCTTVTEVLRRLRVDDPLDAIAVHGMCGLEGLIAAGVFPADCTGLANLGIDHDYCAPDHKWLMQLGANMWLVCVIVCFVGLLSLLVWSCLALLEHVQSTQVDILDTAEHAVNDAINIHRSTRGPMNRSVSFEQVLKDVATERAPYLASMLKVFQKETRSDVHLKIEDLEKFLRNLQNVRGFEVESALPKGLIWKVAKCLSRYRSWRHLSRTAHLLRLRVPPEVELTGHEQESTRGAIENPFDIHHPFRRRHGHDFCAHGSVGKARTHVGGSSLAEQTTTVDSRHLAGSDGTEPSVYGRQQDAAVSEIAEEEPNLWQHEVSSGRRSFSLTASPRISEVGGEDGSTNTSNMAFYQEHRTLTLNANLDHLVLEKDGIFMLVPYDVYEMHRPSFEIVKAPTDLPDKHVPASLCIRAYPEDTHFDAQVLFVFPVHLEVAGFWRSEGTGATRRWDRIGYTLCGEHVVVAATHFCELLASRKTQFALVEFIVFLHETRSTMQLLVLHAEHEQCEGCKAKAHQYITQQCNDGFTRVKDQVMFQCYLEDSVDVVAGGKVLTSVDVNHERFPSIHAEFQLPENTSIPIDFQLRARKKGERPVKKTLQLDSQCNQSYALRAQPKDQVTIMRKFSINFNDRNVKAAIETLMKRGHRAGSLADMLILSSQVEPWKRCKIEADPRFIYKAYITLAVSPNRDEAMMRTEIKKACKAAAAELGVFWGNDPTVKALGAVPTLLDDDPPTSVEEAPVAERVKRLLRALSLDDQGSIIANARAIAGEVEIDFKNVKETITVAEGAIFGEAEALPEEPQIALAAVREQPAQEQQPRTNRNARSWMPGWPSRRSATPRGRERVPIRLEDHLVSDTGGVPRGRAEVDQPRPQVYTGDDRSPSPYPEYHGHAGRPCQASI